MQQHPNQSLQVLREDRPMTQHIKSNAMTGQLTQDRRVAELKTPLGKDVLVLANFVGSEALSKLFEYDIEALSEQENIDFDKAMGQPCTITQNAYDGKKRIYNGILTAARWAGKKEDY